jgi:TolA-binding protein
MRSPKSISKFFLPALGLLFCFDAFSQKTLSTNSDFPILKDGFELFDKGNIRAASEEFKKHGDISSGDLQQTARFYEAWCAELLHQPNAEERLLEFNRQYPGSQYEGRVWLNLGRHHYRLKKWEPALEYFSKAGESKLDYTDRAEADYKTGVAAFQLQQFDRARVAFRKARGGNHRYAASAAYYCAFLNLRDNQLDEALSDLDQAEKSDEFKASIPVLRASILYKKRSFAEAAAFAESCFKDTARIANPEELHLIAGESWFNLRDYEKAAGHFELYSKTIKSNMPRPLQFRMAFSAYKTNQTDRAITGFRQVAAKLDTAKGKQDTLGQAGSYYLGICYLKKEQKQFALNAFDVASSLEADPRIQEDAWFQAGKISYDLEKYAEAIDILKDFTANFPSSAYAEEANELIGEGLLNTQDFEAALQYMEKNRVKSERLTLAYQRAAYQRGTVLFNDGNPSKAAEMFQTSLKYPSDKETQLAAQYWLAESYARENQQGKAAQEYAQCLRTEGIASSPFKAKALYGLGYAHYNQKDYSKALGNFRECVQECEKSGHKHELPDALLRMADCQYATKDYPAALKTYDKAMDARTPEMDYAFYQKGVVYSSMKEFENARTNFSVVVEKYPKSRLYDQAVYQKAQMDFEAGNYQSAIRGYGNIIENMDGSPVIPYCYLNRGISASNLKEFQVAAKDFRHILDAYPSHPAANSAILGLQEALVQTGEVDQLNEYIGKYKKANPESDALESIEFETCKALYNNQKYDKAITGFQDYLKNYGNSSFAPEARFFLAESMYRGGSKQESLSLYKEILSQGRSNWFIRSSFRVAELEFAAGNYQSASDRYTNLLNGVVKSNKDVNNASLGLIESQFQLGRFDTVSLLCSELLKKENLAVDVANKASLYAAKVFVGKGEYEKAIDELLNTVNNAQDINGAEAQYLVGEVFYKQQKYNESLAALFELKSRFAAYPKWYNKGFLLMADNYVAMKENFQAQATLKSIIENAKDKETVAGAKTRLAALKAAEDL